MVSRSIFVLSWSWKRFPVLCLEACFFFKREHGDFGQLLFKTRMRFYAPGSLVADSQLEADRHSAPMLRTWTRISFVTKPERLRLRHELHVQARILARMYTLEFMGWACVTLQWIKSILLPFFPVKLYFSCQYHYLDKLQHWTVYSVSITAYHWYRYRSVRHRDNCYFVWVLAHCRI